jgi:hypothetical protein
MNMKTGFIIAALLMCFSAASIAQSPVSFGLRGGVNFQNLNGKNATGGNLDNKIKVGFNAGVTADIPVAAPDYFVQTGLLFTTKGAKVESVGGPANKVNLNYLEIPITFLYKPVLGEGRLLLGVGPYLGFGIGGSADYGDVDFDNDLKRFDAGGNVLFGYQFTPNISAQLNAQLGLVNIQKNTTGDETIKNTGFGVSLGYHF